ncbi:MAG: type II toxin-antitoxin system PemK/MazF family toxin [Candidatus Nanohaloarchaea archaeon]|nr:type II toxin-antitoxin system PemK/MazF family toxin [Candidatus Nanohaloarchaea archaeon]
MMELRRGDIIIVDLEPTKGSEQGKIRPGLVVQNDAGNRNAATTIIAPLTTKGEAGYPFTVALEAGEGNIDRDSVILLNQLRTVSVPHRVRNRVGSLDEARMQEVDRAIKVSLALD